jgi:hypothetical protein
VYAIHCEELTCEYNFNEMGNNNNEVTGHEEEKNTAETKKELTNESKEIYCALSSIYVLHYVYMKK